jgi:HPt (histidine-containing phosphotransfer) domain-containing protein
MDHKLYNLKKLDEIAQGNQGFIQEMLVTFVENVTVEIGGIQSFKAAENWTAIAETAHKLASNFAYLGADGLHALAVDIEKSVINDHNLTGVADKTDKLCNEGILLISQLKKNFDIAGTN